MRAGKKKGQWVSNAAAWGGDLETARVYQNPWEATISASMTTFRRISIDKPKKKNNIFSLGLISWGVHPRFINQRDQPILVLPKDFFLCGCWLIPSGLSILTWHWSIWLWVWAVPVWEQIIICKVCESGKRISISSWQGLCRPIYSLI